MIHQLINLLPYSYQLISCKLFKESINQLNPQTLSQRKKYLCPPDEIQEAYQCISSFSSITTTCFAAISLLTTFIFAIIVCCIHTQTLIIFYPKRSKIEWGIGKFIERGIGKITILMALWCRREKFSHEKSLCLCL